MFAKLRNSQIIVICTLFGLIVGLVAQFNSNKTFAHKVSVKFNSNHLQTYPDFFNKDTAIVIEENIIRNYTIKGNSRNNPNSLFKLKVTTPRKKDIGEIKEVFASIHDIDSYALIVITSVTDRKKNNLILAYTLLGLLVGLVITKSGWPK